MIQYEADFSAPLSFVRDDDNSLVYYGVDLGGAFLKLGAIGTGRYDKWQSLSQQQQAAQQQQQQSEQAPVTPQVETMSPPPPTQPAQQ